MELDRVLCMQVDLERRHVDLARQQPVVAGIEEPVQISPEIEPTDPGMLTRPRRKGHPRIDVAKTGPASEPDRRVIVLLNLRVLDLRVQRIVRIRELGAEG